MNREKILEVLEMTRLRIESNYSCPAQRIDERKSFGMCSKEKLAAHALYLIETIPSFINEQGKWGKVNRHFASMQMICSFLDLYTLTEMKELNIP